MPAAEVHGPVGRRARDGHDAASLDGELSGRKTAAGIDRGIGIKCLHPYERKKNRATETVTLIKQNYRKPGIRRPTNSPAARMPALTI